MLKTEVYFNLTGRQGERVGMAFHFETHHHPSPYHTRTCPSFLVDLERVFYHHPSDLERKHCAHRPLEK